MTLPVALEDVLAWGCGQVKAELTIQSGNETVAINAAKAGLHVVVEQADIARVAFLEDSDMLEIHLKEGSRISLHCTFEAAQSLAVRLLPEERDQEFLFYARSGERYCAWDDLR